MGGYGNNALIFLIQTIFGLYLLAIMLRFLLQVTRAHFNNPVSQFLVKVTNPPLIPMRRFIPGLMGIDIAAIVLLVIVQAIELSITGLIQGLNLAPIGLLVLTVAELLQLMLNVFLFAILIQVIISWVNPGLHNPVMSLLYTLNEPLLGRARRLIPPISGFDLSPIVVMVVLQLIAMLFIAPIRDMGRMLMGASGMGMH